MSALAPRRRWEWRPKLRWFAAEIVVVVAGVLIALALNAWWGARQDRATEQSYLRQLAADLVETERVIADTEARLATPEWATGELLRAFKSPERPPRDSLVRWLVDYGRLRVALPVTGTIEALIATGDLALVRDDSLRTAITAYAQAMAVTAQSQHQWAERERTARDVVGSRVDYDEARAERMSPEALDSLARTVPVRGIQSGERRHPFPFTVESVLTDRVVYDAVRIVSTSKWNMIDYRREMRDATRVLRERVDAQIHR